MRRSFLTCEMGLITAFLLCVLPCACLCSGEKVHTLPSGLSPQPTMPLVPKHLGYVHCSAHCPLRCRAQGGKTRPEVGPQGLSVLSAPRHQRHFPGLGWGMRAVHTGTQPVKSQAERRLECEALIWLQDRTRKPQRCPNHSKFISSAGAQQGLWLSLGRSGQASKPWRLTDAGTLEGSEKEVVIGLMTGSPHCLNQSRPGLLAQPVLTRPLSWPEPCLPAHVPQGSHFRVLPLTTPLHQQGLLLTPSSRKPFRYQ